MRKKRAPGAKFGLAGAGNDCTKIIGWECREEGQSRVKEGWARPGDIIC